MGESPDQLAFGGMPAGGQAREAARPRRTTAEGSGTSSAEPNQNSANGPTDKPIKPTNSTNSTNSTKAPTGKKPARPTTKPGQSPAEVDPIARVAVDMPLAHLDRPFDYQVAAEQAADAVPGSRVRVRFAGQQVDGYLLERRAESEHTGRIAFLARVVSPEPVLSPEIAALARRLADRYAGTLADVLRLAIPPRHARAEAAAPTSPPAETRESPAGPVDVSGWRRYRTGPAYVGALAEGKAPRAVWTALPGEDWPRRVAEAADACVRRGKGVVVVVPDARDLGRLDAAMTAVLGADRHVTLAASLGPEARYKRWLAVRRGVVQVAIGTRSTAFAPVHDLGLAVIWDDGDDLHDEPRAPYPHAREVLLTRAQLTGAGVLVGASARSSEAQLLVASGWAAEITAERSVVREAAPRVTPAGEDAEIARDGAAAGARLPSLAWRLARESLAAGAPVLVQVPRRGYLPSVACQQCRQPARCTSCSGPLALGDSAAVPACRWCGRLAAGWTCGSCGSPRLRASVVGARRTAEELGRAFPGAAVRTSGRDGILAAVPAEPALVIATPGAEPVCAAPGYGAALLLDSWALLTRVDLRAGEEALRRWMNAVALVRPMSAGGRVFVHADAGLAVVQALVRSDPGWYADRELAERASLRFPPAVRMASITGTAEAVADLIETAALPDGTEPLGPVPVTAPAHSGTDSDVPTERMLLRTTRGNGMALAAALHAAAGVRSARKAKDPVRVEIDPVEMW